MDRPRETLEELRQVFAQIAREDQEIDLSEFKQALGLKDEYLASRLFSIFDTDNSGTVDVEEFLNAVEQLVFATPEEKLRFSYKLQDRNNDNSIDREEITDLIEASLTENNLNFPPEQVTALVDVLFLEADKDNNGEISFEEFKTLMEQNPELLDAMAVSPVSWLKPRQREDQTVSLQAGKRFQKLNFKHYVQNNWIKLAFLFLYVLTNLFLFFGAVDRYASQGANIYIQLARGCGAALNFNGALILIPMLRNFLTWLRKTKLSQYLPLDESVEFHKLVGQVMFAFAILHTIAHFLNYTTLPVSFAQSLFATKAGLSGFLLLVVFAVMWVTAQEPVRKGGNFALFYMAHMGYVLWFILALIHGPNFWKWVSVPLIGFAIEQIIRLQTTKQPTRIVNASLLPSKVLGLEVERPPSFEYIPGEYLFVKCPSISNFEWHPFTISSAPEMPDVLTLHIRAIGSWTGKLYELFRERRDEWIREPNSNADPEITVYLDGPYGTPSVHIFESEYVMLIAAGIGVTPFASILRSILYRNKQGSSKSNLKKVHFYWVNRQQRAFEWFVQLLSEIEAEDINNIFDINLYLTGAQKKSDMKSSTLFVAMDLMHAQTKVDLITGLKSQTQTGRPDWSNIFRDVAGEHSGHKVDVFFCGPPGLSKQLKKLSDKHRFNYRKENF